MSQKEIMSQKPTKRQNIRKNKVQIQFLCRQYKFLGCYIFYNKIQNIMDQYDSEFANYNVATLNYSSSIVSPYQFHEYQAQDLSLFQFQLDSAFKFFAEQEFPNFNSPDFDWGMSAMDLVWKDRFSPFYRQQCGVNSNGKMMNEKEFLSQWNKQCEQIKTKIIQQGVQRQLIRGTKLSKEEIAANLEKQIIACRTYDLLGYKAFIKVFYGLDNINQLDVSADKYKTERAKHFSKIYLNKDLKRQRTIQMIQNRGFDIFCMQQCNKQVVEFFKNNLSTYVVVQMANKLSQICDSIILLKKSKFPGCTSQSIDQQRQRFLSAFANLIKNPGSFSKKVSVQTINYLNQNSEEHKDDDKSQTQIKIHQQLFWNKDTCYAVVGSLIIFSPHISTKVNLNALQINQMKKTITKILTYFPDKQFICAGDLNGEFENQVNFQTADKKYIKINAFPYHNDDITCYKMRSLTQTQKNKALQVSFCKKDYIITDLRINQQTVMMADGSQVTKANAPLIPNERHPFDHFIVSASLRMLDRIQSCSPLRRKKPVSSPFEGFSLDFAPDKNA